MSRESFLAEARALKERVQADGQRAFDAYVAQEKHRAEVATQTLKMLARQHGVDETRVKVENGLPPYNSARRATFFFLGL